MTTPVVFTTNIIIEKKLCSLSYNIEYFQTPNFGEKILEILIQILVLLQNYDFSQKNSNDFSEISHNLTLSWCHFCLSLGFVLEFELF